jgi:hypothetical protein
VYYAYFGVKLGNQDKSWAPHKVCYVCVEDLKKWSKGKKKAFEFGIPMLWRKLQKHNGNNYASLPIGHSVDLKESYEILDTQLMNG